MNMLSAQCDKLRSMAKSVELSMPQAATLMMEAADTITELRGALQVASVDYRHLQDENAKLREELEQWHRLTAGIELPEYPITEFKPKDLERENAKLRELCADMWRGAVTRMDFAERYAFIGEFVDRMRELEVDA